MCATFIFIYAYKVINLLPLVFKALAGTSVIVALVDLRLSKHYGMLISSSMQLLSTCVHTVYTVLCRCVI